MEQPSKESKETLRNKLFISYGTIGGFVIFAIVLTIFIVLEVSATNPFTSRMTSALLGLTIILFLLGIIIDQLKYRNFRFWALGAMVSFLGVVLLFSPVLIYGLGNNDQLLWILLIGVGILLVLFGYTIDAYDLNNKVAKILINLWENIKHFEWKKIPGKLASLLGAIFIGIGSYIVLGFKKFRYVLRSSFLAIYSFTRNTLKGLVRLIRVLPHYTKKFLIFAYEYNYWLIIPLFIFAIIKIVNLPFPEILVFVLGFLYMLLLVMMILNSNEELAETYLKYLRDKSWEAVQSISIRIQKTTSSIGRYKCQNCKNPIKLGQELCENCKTEIKQCSICKLPIKQGQDVSVCSHCQYPAHSNHWDQWIRMKNTCPICKN